MCKSKRELEQVQLQTELMYLKSQINPHFLFNSLNNLYALTLLKSDLAPQIVLRLSDILRYVLYESSTGKVDIQKELQHLQDFIELEKLRLGDHIMVDVDLAEPKLDLKIEPMLYLTLVENAFKHGVSQNTEHSFIYIDLKIKGNNLIFRVENSYNYSESDLEADYTKGIGLKNVKRRLDLIYGEEGFILEVFKEEDSFTIVLNISLIPKNE